MRGKSHRFVGRLLADRYMKNAPSVHRRAFLLGCIQPDRNPASYLKGSLRSQWLRGHHYGNALPFMLRTAHRLSGRQNLSLWDWYTAGKLIHYTIDAFTYAHNRAFPEDMAQHRAYECRLQEQFLRFLEESPELPENPPESALEILWLQHRQYRKQWGQPETDCDYAFSSSCRMMQLLTKKLSFPG